MNAKKLKNTDIFIENDYSRCTLRRWRLLWQSAKGNKDNGKRVFLDNDKLRIDNDTFVWDDGKNERVKFSCTSPSPDTA